MNKQMKYFLSYHTIFIMSENIDWIEEFLKYHLAIGFEHFYLYDNEGSVGRNGSTSTHNKYGFEIEKDENTAEKWENIMKKYGDKITYKKWQPTDEEGNIQYGQKECIEEFIETYGKETEWVAFMDLDEFVFSQENIDIPGYFESLPMSISCVRICQKKFKDRFLMESSSGSVIKMYDCIDKEIGFEWAPKNILRPADYVGFQTIHDIKVKYEIKYEEPRVLRFNHYNVNSKLLTWMKEFYQSTAEFSLNGVDDGMKRYSGLFEKKGNDKGVGNGSSRSVLKEGFDLPVGEPVHYLIWIMVVLMTGLIMYVTDGFGFLWGLFIKYIRIPMKKYI
jgi:hypothetical protein